MEAFSLGASATPGEAPVTNGDSHGSGGIHGRIRGLNKWPGNGVRSPSGTSTTSSKGKGKSANKKGKGSRTDAESDGSIDGDDENMADEVHGDEDEDDYVVRTDHLRNPMEEVE